MAQDKKSRATRQRADSAIFRGRGGPPPAAKRLSAIRQAGSRPLPDGLAPARARKCCFCVFSDSYVVYTEIITTNCSN